MQMDSWTTMTDDELIKEFRDTENPAAFVEIYNRYHAQLYSSARKRCLSSEVAEEIVQDLFINLWKNKSSIRINTSLSGYLFTATRNLLLNHIQKEAVRKKYELSFGLKQTEYDNSTEEELIANDLCERLAENVSQLPDKCRSVFELSRNKYKTNKEIAYELGISEKTVENHITRAIRSLRVGLHISAISWIFINLFR